MRLANGIVIDKKKTFGVLNEVKERTYDLKSRGQGKMIQVSIPSSILLKEFDYNEEVDIINPVADTVAIANFNGTDVDWYIKLVY